MKATSIVLALLFILGVLPAPSYAQQYEVSVYSGGFLPTGNLAVGRFRNEGMYGVKAGYFVTPSFEAGFNAAYINHFDLKTTDPLIQGLNRLGFTRPAVHGAVWELTGDYNFGTWIFDGKRIEPFAGLGAGGFTVAVRPVNHAIGADTLLPSRSTVIAGGGNIIANAPPELFAGGDPTAYDPGQTTTLLKNGNSFFGVSLGGGVRVAKLLGPMGVRVEARTRSLPNFLGDQLNWTEVTGGLTFTWGDREP
jgi:hypothetical protein